MFTWLLYRKGIPCDKLVALDLPEEDKTHRFRSKFWNIRTDYDISKDDIIFIGWGGSGIDDIIFKYINEGGKCIIIQGEIGYCTFTTDYISDNPEYKEDWETYDYLVAPSLSCYHDHLTVNTKYDQK